LKSNFRLRLFSLFSFFILFLLCFNLTNLISGEQARSTSFPASDPVIFSCSVLPTKVQPGDLMTVSAVVFDFPGIEKVEACFSHELGFDTVYLSLVIGSSHLGVWRGQWLVHDTKIKEYSTQVTAFSSSGLYCLLYHQPLPVLVYLLLKIYYGMIQQLGGIWIGVIVN